MLRAFIDLLVSGLPESQRPSDVVAQATVGAIWSIVHRHVTQGHGRLLPTLVDQLSYVALAPLVGAGAAIDGIPCDQGRALLTILRKSVAFASFAWLL